MGQGLTQDSPGGFAVRVAAQEQALATDSLSPLRRAAGRGAGSHTQRSRVADSLRKQQFTTYKNRKDVLGSTGRSNGAETAGWSSRCANTAAMRHMGSSWS
jgi:hypothetical protein